MTLGTVAATTALAPTAPASAASAQGCGYADSSPNNGNYSGTICWFDFSGFNETAARAAGGQPMQVTLQGGFVAKFNAVVADVANTAPMTMQARSTPLETRFAFGTDAYRGIPGLDTLYSDPAPAGVLKGAKVSFTNIQVVDADGNPVTGYSFVAADTEDNVAGESFTWSSDKPLNEIERLAPNGNWGCKNPIGEGTTQISCAGTGAGGSTTAGGKSTALLISANTPSTFATQWETPQQSGIAIGIQTAKLTLNKQINGRVDPADSFDISVVSPEGTVAGAATTGIADTATTGGLTVLPRISSSYTLSEAVTGGSPALLSNYTTAWSCVNAATGSSTTLPTGSGITKTVDPAIGDDITCTITNTALPATLGIVKHAGTPADVNGDGITDAGDTIQYTFTVTNTGQLPMSNIGVTDPKAGPVTCPQTTLAVGASEECTADAPYAITADDAKAGAVNNSATSHGTAPGSSTTVTSDQSTTSTPVTPAAPALTLVKSANPSDAAAYQPGQVITYSFVVTNTGNVPVNDVHVVEDTFSGSNGAPEATCPSPTLAAGAQEVCTATYTLTAADVNAGSLTNTATAHGTGQGSDTDVPSNSSTVTIPETPAPGITVVKTANPSTVTAAGQTVTYSFVVTNTGNVTLAVPDGAVQDTNFSGTGTLSPISCPETSLVAGQVETCTATYTVTQADVNVGTITNSAMVTGTPPGGGEVVSPPSPPATVTIDRTPALSVVKTANVQAAEVGQTITYTFTLTNTGNVTITNPTVADTNFSGDPANLSALNCPANVVLQPTDLTTCTATYTVTQADIDAGQITNAATATGTPPDGVTPPTADAPPVVVTTNPHPALSLVKTASTQQVTTVGQVITYTFAVTNTGNVDVKDPKVNEGTFTGHGTLSAVTCPGGSTLPPGQMISCTATYAVVAADLADAGTLSNTATVTGTLPGGDLLTSDPSTAKVAEVAPAAPAAALASTGSDTWTAALAGLGLLVLGLLAAAAAWIQRRNRTNPRSDG